MEYIELLQQTKYPTLKKNKFIYGLENGYYFVIEESNNIGLCKIKFDLDNVDKAKEVAESLRKTHPEIVIGGYRSGSLGENFLEINILGYTSAQSLVSLLQDITQAFKQANLRQICVQNNTTENLGLYLVGRRIEILSGEGFESSKEEVKRYKGKHNSGLGIAYLGAFIGAIIGMLIWIAAMNIIPFAVFAVAIPFFIFKGFTFKGCVPRKIDVYVLIALSILTILISDPVNRIINVGIKGGLQYISVLEIIKLSFENINDLLLNNIFTFVVVAAYSAYSIKTYLYDAPTTTQSKNKYKKLM